MHGVFHITYCQKFSSILDGDVQDYLSRMDFKNKLLPYSQGFGTVSRDFVFHFSLDFPACLDLMTIIP